VLFFAFINARILVGNQRSLCYGTEKDLKLFINPHRNILEVIYLSS